VSKRVDRAKSELQWAAGALRDRVTRLAERRRAALSEAAARLNALSPLATLQRGYAVARAPDGRALTSVGAFAPGDDFRLLLRDGEIAAGGGGKRVSFEERLKRLEQIVSELETDELELERALKLFEEGITALRGATEDLGKVEARLRRLVERADGTFEVTDLRE
jgi:exodeoxyribonuclease VII small subunit